MWRPHAPYILDLVIQDVKSANGGKEENTATWLPQPNDNYAVEVVWFYTCNLWLWEKGGLASYDKYNIHSKNQLVQLEGVHVIKTSSFPVVSFKHEVVVGVSRVVWLWLISIHNSNILMRGFNVCTISEMTIANLWSRNYNLWVC
jgi:hypothetical protein